MGVPNTHDTAIHTPKPLNLLSFDPELTPGARNAVRVCLRIQPAEKVTIITDKVSREIAASLARVGCDHLTAERGARGSNGARLSGIPNMAFALSVARAKEA